MYSPSDSSVQKQRTLCDHLVSSTDVIRSKHPGCGVVILGDFNHLSIQDLVRSHLLKQVVFSPTRRDAILDYNLFIEHLSFLLLLGQRTIIQSCGHLRTFSTIEQMLV